jgi:hypothetical protein
MLPTFHSLFLIKFVQLIHCHKTDYEIRIKYWNMSYGIFGTLTMKSFQNVPIILVILCLPVKLHLDRG